MTVHAADIIMCTCLLCKGLGKSKLLQGRKSMLINGEGAMTVLPENKRAKFQDLQIHLHISNDLSIYLIFLCYLFMYNEAHFILITPRL